MNAHPARRRRARSTVAIAATVCTAAGILPLLAQAASAETLTAPYFAITAEGITPDQGDQLAKNAGIGNATRVDGSFDYKAEDFATAPTIVVGKGRDEHDRPTVSEALDVKALKAMTTLPDSDAKALAARLVPIQAPYTATAKIGNTVLKQVDTRGRTVLKQALDTTVSYQLALAGKPVVGPGAKLSISFAGDGSVRQLSEATRSVRNAGRVEIMSAAEARKQCGALYGGAAQDSPVLSYYAPPLAADRASGKGAAQLVTPQYVCQPAATAKDEVSALTGRLVPAAPSLSPTVRAGADYDGRTMTASARVDGGTAPYTYRWSSSSTPIDGTDSSVSYTPRSRAKLPETLSLTVTDANGAREVLSLTPSARFGTPGSAEADGTPGGNGGAFYEAGIEQTVDEWACAQASADGFKQVMQDHSQTVNFDWRGTNAWERDFKESGLGGDDGNYVDAVDIQWYTGHGNSGGFTFKNTSHDDGSIVPGDASWGTQDLEWVNLESCQVLKDTNGAADYFGRWGPTMDGLHLLNGFDTNAQCVGGGTGRRFAEYLFPQNFLWWTVRPALTVSQAWASMADDLEPAGTRWRSMSVIGANGVNDLGDHFWGQGSTGPDLTYANRSGMISISGMA